MRTMFGDDERLRLGQIKHLTGGMADTRVRPKARTAHNRCARVMIDNVVRIRDLSQGLAPCDPSARPVACRCLPAGSSPVPASSVHRSTEACRCSSCSIRADAQVPRSGLSATRFQPSAPQSARSVLPWTARFPLRELFDFLIENRFGCREKSIANSHPGRLTWAVTIFEQNRPKRLAHVAQSRSNKSSGARFTGLKFSDVAHAEMAVHYYTAIVPARPHKAAFAEADAALATERAHLTTVAAGRIAREAGVRRIEPFHFSPRYAGEEGRLLNEVVDAFSG